MPSSGRSRCRKASKGSVNALTATGLSTSEGEIVRSANGKYLTVTGYDAAPGTTGPGGLSLTASQPTSVARTVGVVDGNGAVDTSTTLSDAGEPAIVRSAATARRAHLWVAGGNGGLRATTLASHTSTVVAGDATSNLNQVSVQGGALFTSSSSGARLSLVAPWPRPASAARSPPCPGCPPASSRTATRSSTSTPNNYAGTGLDTLYFLNDADRGGAVDKYSYNGTTWVSDGSVALDGAFALTATVSGASVSLAVTTPGGLYSLADSNGAATTFTHRRARRCWPAPLPTRPSAVSRWHRSRPRRRRSSCTTRRSARPSSARWAPSVSPPTCSSAKGIKSVLVGLDKHEGGPGQAGQGHLDLHRCPRPQRAQGRQPRRAPRRRATSPAPAPRSPAASRTASSSCRPRPPARATTRLVFTKGVVRKGFAAVGYKGAPRGKGLIATATGKVTVTVYGRGLQLHLALRKDGGKVKVTVGSKSYVIDTYGKKAKDYTKVFSGLKLGKHKVTITALHTKRAASTGYTVFVGWVKVTL